jgi:hypothetical protein
MGACGYILSYVAINGLAVRGPLALGSLALYWRSLGVATGGMGTC